MPPLSPEQVTAAQKASLDALFGLVGKVFEGTEKLVALNLHVIKSTLAEARENATKAPAIGDPQQWLALQVGVAGSFAEKWQSFGRDVLDITSTTQAEITQFARTQYEQHSARVQTLVEEAAKSGPPGSEAAVAAWKSAISATSTWYDTFQKTSDQAMHIAQSNLDAVTTTASRRGRLADGQVPVAVGAKR